MACNTTPGHLQFHPREREDCGYILTIGGTRIYIAGDTEPTPEMKRLKEIDVAFLPVNQPYTMTVDQAVEAVKAIRPAIFSPTTTARWTRRPTSTAWLPSWRGSPRSASARWSRTPGCRAQAFRVFPHNRSAVRRQRTLPGTAQGQRDKRNGFPEWRTRRQTTRETASDAVSLASLPPCGERLRSPRNGCRTTTEWRPRHQETAAGRATAIRGCSGYCRRSPHFGRCCCSPHANTSRACIP